MEVGMSAARFYEISMGFSAAGLEYQSWLLDLGSGTLKNFWSTLCAF